MSNKQPAQKNKIKILIPQLKKLKYGVKIITIIYTSHITVIVNGMYSLDFKNIIDKYKIQPIPILHVIIAPPSIKPSPIFFFSS